MSSMWNDRKEARIHFKGVGSLAIASLLTLTVISVAAKDRDDHGDRRWGSEAVPQAGVCFYEDTNFHGRYFCVDSNDDLGKLPRDMRDRISSLRVIGSVGAIVFRDDKFKGPSARFVTDVRDLRKQGWNDQISSIRVTKPEFTWDDSRLPAWGREAMPTEGACFYKDVDFNGDYFCLPRGASYALLPPGFNDTISSVRVIRGEGVQVFQDRDFDGRAGRLTTDVPDLRRGVWNDSISSIRVF